MQRPKRLFRGTEFIRLVSMIGMLIVLGSLIVVIKKSNQASAPETATTKKTASTPSADPVTAEKITAATTSRPDLTDQDPEQRQAAIEEFEAVTDKTTEIQREEMAAYWRLLTWVTQQPFTDLNKRSKTNFVVNDLMQEPSVHRGELLRLELNVRRVLAYEVPDNRLGVKQVYEVWGWTSESQAWPYVAIVLDIPTGFPVGPDVSERAVFCGYFFKLQGYLEAGADPRARPLAAPLLLGRMEARPRKPAPVVGSEGPWLVALAIVAGLMLLTRIGWLIRRRYTRQAAPVKTREIEVLPPDQWLEGMQRAGLDTHSPRQAQHPYESKPKLN
jgi:hypothetical protein